MYERNYKEMSFIGYQQTEEDLFRFHDKYTLQGFSREDEKCSGVSSGVSDLKGH